MGRDVAWFPEKLSAKEAFFFFRSQDPAGRSRHLKETEAACLPGYQGKSGGNIITTNPN